MNYNNIFKILNVAKQNDPDFKKFGAKSHNYKFNQTLQLEDINEFERINKVNLPEDYKEFITKVGNGGFGPYYGFESLYNSTFDFKLKENPKILISENFPYIEKWNANWIESFNWEESLPQKEVVDEYMEVISRVVWRFVIMDMVVHFY